MPEIAACFKQLMQYHVFGSTRSLPKLESIDLDTLMEWIDEHRMVLAFYPLIKTWFPQNHPIHVRKQQYINQYIRHRKMLLTLTEGLRKEMIPYAILKGIPLNQFLYGNRLVRHAKDIDILIEKKHMLRFKEYIERIGYKLIDYLGMYDTTFCHTSTQTIIDIVTKEPSHGEETQSIDIEGHSVTTLTPEINFTYLCFHGAKHDWKRLKWLVDIADFRNSPMYNHEKIIEFAKQQNLIISLLEADAMLKNTFDLSLEPIPASFRDRLLIRIRRSFVLKPFDILREAILYPSWNQKRTFIKNVFIKSRHSQCQLRAHPHRSLWLVFTITTLSRIARSLKIIQS